MPHSHATASFFGLLNLLVTLFLLGAVMVISSYLTQIPVAVFIALFGLLTALMAVLTQRAVQQQRMPWARTWGFWGCVFFGIAAIAAAHRLGLLAFIPDLLLVWLLGFALVALWLQHPLLFLLSQVLLTLWLVCTYLYGQSYLPGLAVFLLLGWYLRQPRAAAALLLQALNGLLLAALYGYAVLRPQHYPLEFPPALVLPLLACLALLWAVGQAARLAQPARQDGVWVGQVAGGLGLALLVVLALAPFWQRLRSLWAGPLAPWALALALLVWLLGAALLRHCKAGRSVWLRYLVWVGAALLLQLAGLLPESLLARHLSSLSALLALALALRRLRAGTLQGSPADMLSASLLLVLVVGAAVFSRPLALHWNVLALWALASLLLLALWQSLRAPPRSLAATPRRPTP